MDFADFPQDSASNAERMGWANASPEVIAKVLNSALAAQDLSGFAALLSDIARDRGLKGQRAAHQSIYDMPYASLLPRQKHLLSDAFELLVLLGLELRARRDDDGLDTDLDGDDDSGDEGSADE
ncbi:MULTISPECIES: hypothetical protein [Cupriavidus]|uniref:Uncharacterized protein n=1 Tax=Cupriavidus oxalaticus TaxID=96344 RepID=A0A4P7LKZ8_9BURK|nr:MULTISPECIES: hypothetical protein [Cupriavidus]MBF6989793.1 hypothetical protein [Cupriavidus sp. IK-TO18]QBY52811.1 hypothetical protein E0W60_16750 [Cupriavidus oxalaticus]TDF62339.1 hypothetical protein E1J61_29445 [Cupriavidus sp. L7L]